MKKSWNSQTHYEKVFGNQTISRHSSSRVHYEVRGYMQEIWVIASNVALFFAALITTVLVGVYGIFTRWESTQVGRQFMLTKASFAIVLDFSSVITAVSPRTWKYMTYTPVRFFVYLIVGIIMLRWLIILIRIQRQHRSQARRAQ